MARLFTLEEAQGLIPRVSRLLGDAVALRAGCSEVENAIRSSVERIMMMGGMSVDPEAARVERARLASSAIRLKEVLEEVEKIGCQVKDLDIGLIDFPTAYQGAEACLCWKLGEPEIQFWHRADEGYAGRKPIDREFRENHGSE